MKDKRSLFMLVGLALACLLASTVGLEAAGEPNGRATPRKVANTWLSVTTIPDNPFTGPLVIEELDTFTADGTIVTSTSLPYLELAPGFLVVSSASHGNWKSIGGRWYEAVQLRFLTDFATGTPAGYVRSVTKFRFVGRSRMSGEFLVQLLDPDKNVLFEIDGGTVEFSLVR